MSKPSTVTLRVPRELKQRLEEAAQQQGVSLNQFALYILAGEVTRLEISQAQAWAALDQQHASKATDDSLLTQARAMLRREPVQTSLPDWDAVEG
ncbi:MAG: toxin-antitoxin system HicB family antitoxin [Candidatus Sericytochromatia bacterium]|nr:toxin-antitoxin system HicB family antitoxin [Candidatus Sericytochromatia bacterium]